MAYFDKQTETAPRDQLEAMQWQKLRTLLEVTYARNAFYQRKFAEHGIGLPDIRGLGDLDKLPFTTKLEFQEDQEEHPPFGTNLSEPLEAYVQYLQTTGTTGKPLKWLDTEESWRWRARCQAHAFCGAGLTSKDVLMLPFNFGPYAAFWGAYETARLLGMLAVPTGGWETIQRLRCLVQNPVTALATTPTYARRMAEVAREEGIDIRNSKVRAIILAGEPGAMVPAIREKIESAWGAGVYDYAGQTEVGTYAFTCEHSKRTLALHVIESECLVEVIDPSTGKAVPEGTVGELVITNLGRIGSPAIRLRTGDLVKLRKTNCPCERTFAVLEGGILGRSDDMLLVRGVNVFPSAVSNIVEEILPPEREYRIMRCRTADGADDLKVQIEVAQGTEQLPDLLAQEFKKRLNLRIEVEAVPVGTIPRSDYKSKRVIDRGGDTTP